MNRNKIILIFSSLLLAIIVLSGGRWLPLSSESAVIVSSSESGPPLLLKNYQVASQNYLGKGGWQTGLTLYTTSQITPKQRLTVRILNSTEQELTRTSTWQTTYLPADDTAVLNFSHPWVKTSPNEHLTAEIWTDRGDTLWLRASSQHIYRGGIARIDNQAIDRDLALAITYAEPLPHTAQPGIIAAVVLIIGVGLILALPLKKTVAWLTAGFLLAAATPLALWGFFSSLGNLGISDWDLYFSYHEVVRRTLLVFHSFPFWNPWLCGGTAALADPEFPLFTFTFLLELIFGIPLGLRLAIILSVATTAIGMLALAKRLGLSITAAIMAALGTAFGSVSLLEIVEGHPNVFAAMWLPWIFWAWLAAYQKIENRNKEIEKIELGNGDKRQIHLFSIFYFLFSKLQIWPLVCGIFLALTFYAGGIYLLMYTSLAFLGLIALVSQPKSALRTTLAAGLWALGFAALKLIPVIWWLWQFPDENYASSTYTLPWLEDILFGRHLHGSNIIFNQQSGWHEYGAYIGYTIGALALIGSAKWLRSRLVRMLVIAAIAAILLSSAGPVLIPIFDQAPFIPRSNISRIILLAVIPLSLLAGFGLDDLTRKIRQSKVLISALITLILLALVAVDLLSLSAQLSHQAFVLPPVDPLPAPAAYPIAYTAEKFSTDGQGDRHTRSYAAIRQGYGTLTYCSVLGPPPMVRTIHDEADNNIVSTRPASTAATLLEWTPNQAVFAISAQTESQVILNTNYALGWQYNGRPALNESGRVAASVPAGDSTVTFRFRPSGFWLGLSITLFTIILAVLRVRLVLVKKFVVQ